MKRDSYSMFAKKNISSITSKSNENLISFSPYINAVSSSEPLKIYGKISEVVGLLIESTGPSASVGDICIIERNGKTYGKTEVVGFKKEKTLLMPLGKVEGIFPGLLVVSTKKPLSVGVGKELLGRILNGLGEPIDSNGPIGTLKERPVFSAIPNPLKRERISKPLETGVKAIDSLITIGKGQRMGIFAGSGVGKSILLGMMARHCKADVNVIALIGERGREVREFLERDLGEDGLKKSVVIVATSDQPALIRIKGALIAATIAEYFRDEGMDVLFLVDSVTRLATAQREVGLAIGEPPATKGYTPSVFSLLPQFFERAGTSDKGSITGIFTVLVEGDDMEEPVADTARSVLDGHLVLSRNLAHRNHFPAIDILESISRCLPDIVDKNHLKYINIIKDYMATYRSNEDLIQIGAYVSGTNEKLDKAIKLASIISGFLKQNRDESFSFDESVSQLPIILKSAGLNV